MTKTPWDFACEWYRPEEIRKYISMPKEFGVSVIPEDVYSKEFAEFLCEQYRLAMNKGIEIGRNWDGVTQTRK